MKRIFVIVASGLLLSGCGLTNSLSQKAGEKIMEKTVETQTGGKVDINSDKNTVTVKTDQGETQYSTGGNIKVPDGFPPEFILTQDAKILTSSSNPQAQSVTYTTNETQDNLYTKAKMSIVAAGWKKDLEMDTNGAKLLEFSKGNQKATFNIGENNTKEKDNQSLVNVTLLQQE